MVLRQAELSTLKSLLLRMAALVEVSIKNSVKSLVERDTALAQTVIDTDHQINDLDVQVDEECIKILALTQPVASDLRFITTAMKITTDLERIGDNAVNICERAMELNDEPLLKPYVDIPMMANLAGRMVKDAIDAFVNHDKKLAMDVIMRDDEMDDFNESIFEELTAIMAREPQSVVRAIKITYISKYLERIGDHATNIAEMVIYMIDGKIIRHTTPQRDV